MPDLSTREILENQFNGLTPIKRQNPQYGEKDYYYINPNRDRYSSLSDEDIAYVDSPDDPNPFLQQSSTTNPLSTSTMSTTNPNSLTSPFSSSISATGLSTDNSLTTPTDEPSWYKGFGLSKTNSGLGFKYTSPFETNTTRSYMSTSNPLSSSSSNEMGTDTTGLTGSNYWNCMLSSMNNTTSPAETQSLTNSNSELMNNNLFEINNQTSLNTIDSNKEQSDKLYPSTGFFEKTNNLYSHIPYLNPIRNAGEVIADLNITYDHYKKMKEANNKLIAKIGRNKKAADGTDNYYHSLWQCNLSKISPASRNVGLNLGNLKERMDIFRKSQKSGANIDEILQDSQKDIGNNMYGSQMAEIYPNIPCITLLDNLRTDNMKKYGIW